MQVIVIGVPGSGKSTTAAHIADRYHIPHISYRTLVLNYLERKTPSAQKLLELWRNFQPFPPDLAFHILTEYWKHNTEPSFVLDGYPKTGEETTLLAKWLIHHYPKLKRLFFVLEAPRVTINERLNRRMVCPSCSYVAAWPDPDRILGNRCPNCHLYLFKRQDDTDGKIGYRYNRYQQERLAIINNLQIIGKIHTIDANRMLADVISDVIEICDMEFYYGRSRTQV